MSSALPPSSRRKLDPETRADAFRSAACNDGFVSANGKCQQVCQTDSDCTIGATSWNSHLACISGSCGWGEQKPPRYGRLTLAFTDSDLCVFLQLAMTDTYRPAEAAWRQRRRRRCLQSKRRRPPRPQRLQRVQPLRRVCVPWSAVHLPQPLARQPRFAPRARSRRTWTELSWAFLLPKPHQHRPQPQQRLPRRPPRPRPRRLTRLVPNAL